MTYPLDRLLSGFTEVGAPPLQHIAVGGLASHSEAVQTGDLYLAMPGHRAHGLDFLESAISHGACAVAWDADDRSVAEDCSISSVFIPGLVYKAGIIADRFFHHPSKELQVIAVTGTNGKTSTTHFISEVLHQVYSGCGLIGTLGSGVFGKLKATSNTTPEALFIHRQMHHLLKQDIHHVVLEASSHGLVQGRLSGIHMNVAVLTTFGRDHFDYHGSMQAYKAAKKLLFEIPGLQHAVLNIDDGFGKELNEFCQQKCRTITYSVGHADADVVAQSVKVSSTGLRFELHYGDNFTASVQSRLIGRFNVVNLLAAFSVLMTQGIDMNLAAEILCNIQPIRGRMQPFISTQAVSPLVILDYAHTPDALSSVLQTCAEITTGDLYCVFGCGGNRDQGKRKLMGEVAAQLADIITLTDDNPRDESPEKIVADILQGMKKHAVKNTVIHDRREAIRSTIFRAQQNDCVLVAGKGHETEQIVRGQSIPLDDVQIITEALTEIH